MGHMGPDLKLANKENNSDWSLVELSRKFGGCRGISEDVWDLSEPVQMKVVCSWKYESI